MTQVWLCNIKGVTDDATIAYILVRFFNDMLLNRNIGNEQKAIVPKHVEWCETKQQLEEEKNTNKIDPQIVKDDNIIY